MEGWEEICGGVEEWEVAWNWHGDKLEGGSQEGVVGEWEKSELD